jgi:glycerol-3-phosphate dehydrogenase
MNRADASVYDVAVIGAGVVGCAIARELAQYTVTVALIEAQSDIGKGTSKANTAILHTGFDAKPRSLEHHLLRRGYERLLDFGPQAGIPIEQLGAVLIAWDEAQLAALPGLIANARENGVEDVAIISANEVYRREPRIGLGALGGLIVPGESIICPFTTPLAFATQAVVNGVRLFCDSPVMNIHRQEDGVYALACTDRVIAARFIINAAGLHADTINRMFGHAEFHVTPRRGELIVFDKLSRPLVNHILLPVPTKTTKGVLISPTVFGNVMLGPTAEDLHDKRATDTTETGIASLMAKGRRILPELLSHEVTAGYAGLRAATEHTDYQITTHPDQQYICVGGIRSTGLSASMGIAEYVVEQMTNQCGFTLTLGQGFKSVRMANIGEAFPRPYQSEDLIARDAAYGEIVCFCERVTRGEIRDAMRSPIPAHDADSLRRRTRAQLGRCQGFFCSAQVRALLDQASNSRRVASSGAGDS